MRLAAVCLGVAAASLQLLAAQGPPLVLPDAPDSALPFAVTSRPPAWIEPGLRLTFHTMAGTLPAGDYDYEVDAEGRWVDAAGNRYKRTEAVGTGSCGYLQANVLALTDRQVAVQLLFYLFDGLDESAPTENTELGFVADAGCGGDLWLHPDALRQLLKTGAAGLVVRQLDYPIDQASYRAVLLFWPRPAGRSVWIYDLDSGVLLYSSDITKAGGRQSQTGEQLSAGGSIVRFTTFKSSRTLSIPWSRQPLPPALLLANGFDFRGRIGIKPVTTDTPLPFELRYDVVQRGDGWLACKAVAASVVGGMDTRVRSNHQLTGLWVPPAGCAQLRAGQVLDRDPLTKAAVSVSHVDAEMVVITQESPRQTFQFTYRKRDGLLVRGSFTERMPNSVGMPPMQKVVEMELANVR